MAVLGLIWTAAIFTETGKFTDENNKEVTGFSASLFNKNNLIANQGFSQAFRKSSVTFNCSRLVIFNFYVRL